VNKGLFVVMGVAGSGKSLIGSSLARALGVEFLEGDDFHTAQSIEKMSAGIPLTDEDRAGWLQTLALRLRTADETGSGVVIACSALKRSYRDILRGGAPDTRFIFLTAPREVIAERLASRGGHYMPASMLDSQLATLEEPSYDENAWVVDVTIPPDEIVSDLVARVSL
jgi:carbohydrate kinase (thermoresistant glucokinase family)